jgi:hypothetical protein
MSDTANKATNKGTSMLRRILSFVCIALPALVALTAVLVPREYWHHVSWVRHRVYEGEFDGQPVAVVPPSIGRPTVPLAYRIQMTKGVCRITRIDREGNSVFHSAMHAGYVMRDKIAAGERLQFDPGPNTGHYRVETGLKFHLLSPFLWRSFAYGVLGFLIFVGLASLLLNKRTKTRLETLRPFFTPSQWAVLTILVVFSCAILYPTLHELGHALVGTALGGRVERMVLTPLSGDTPHVRFAQQPPKEAQPWKAAAGTFLPIVVGYGLLILWFALGRRWSRFQQALLLTPAVLLLLPVFSPSDDHLLGMARKLGCSSQWSILLVKGIPALLGVAAYALVAWRIWRQTRRLSADASFGRDTGPSV